MSPQRVGRGPAVWGAKSRGSLTPGPAGPETVGLGPEEADRVEPQTAVGERERRDLLALASLLLVYPDDQAIGQRQTVAAALAGFPGPVARKLSGLAQWRLQADPHWLRLDYVARFDTRRRSCLDVTYCRHGDSRARGPALQGFVRLYRSAGFAPTAGELPDFLPLVLQFAALAPPAAADRALALARPGVVAAAQALARQGSQYADGLAAVLELIPEAAATVDPDPSVLGADPGDGLGFGGGLGLGNGVGLEGGVGLGGGVAPAPPGPALGRPGVGPGGVPAAGAWEGAAV